MVGLAYYNAGIAGVLDMRVAFTRRRRRRDKSRLLLERDFYERIDRYQQMKDKPMGRVL